MVGSNFTLSMQNKKRIGGLFVVFLCCAQLGGCASIRKTFVENDDNKDLVYSGTRYDWKAVTLRPDNVDGPGALAVLILWPFYVIDLPLSLISDTLILPYTYNAAINTQQ